MSGQGHRYVTMQMRWRVAFEFARGDSASVCACRSGLTFHPAAPPKNRASAALKQASEESNPRVKGHVSQARRTPRVLWTFDS